VASDNAEPEHKLFFVTHLDRQAGNAKAMANRRLPIVNPSKDLEKFKKLPAFVSPADIVKAYQLILDTEKDAEAAITAEYIQPTK
jgi:hypothetical protein